MISYRRGRIFCAAVLIIIMQGLLLAQEVKGDPPAAGQNVREHRRYIEYYVGDLPVIISAPHGGELTPDAIPDRLRGVNYTDAGTQELARMIAGELRQRTGKSPYVVINRLKRRKLDANREADEAAQGSDVALNVWKEYHSLIDSARKAVFAAYGTGLYIDLHGHANKVQRVELGYALTAEDLAQDDATLDDFPYADVTTLANLLRRTRLIHSRLLRDTISFGAMLEKRGIHATPSPQDPKPNDENFYAGGYSSRRYTADDGLNIFGFQIELPESMRTSEPARSDLAPKVAEAVLEFLALNTPELSGRIYAN